MPQPVPAPRTKAHGRWVAAIVLAGAALCCGRIGYNPADDPLVDDAASASGPSGVGPGGGGNGGASGAGGGAMDAARTDVDQGGAPNGDDADIDSGERDGFEPNADAPIDSNTGDEANNAIADASVDIGKDQSAFDAADADASVRDAQAEQAPPKICAAGNNCTCNGACSCPGGGCTVTCTGNCNVDCPGSCRMICPMNTTCSIKCSIVRYTCPQAGCDFSCN